MRWRTPMALALAAGMLAPQTLAAQDARPGVAVMVFDNGGSYGQDREDFEALRVGLQQMILTEFATNASLRVVDRSQLRQILEEQDLGAGGRVDAGTAARIGKIVGARYMVMGSFVDFYGDFRLDARIVNVETSEIVKTQKVRNKRENLYEMVVDLADGITRGVDLPALSRQALKQRRERDVNPEALRFYAKGLLYQDRGDSTRAAELFQKALDSYPEYTEASEALKQVS